MIKYRGKLASLSLFFMALANASALELHQLSNILILKNGVMSAESIEINGLRFERSEAQLPSNGDWYAGYDLFTKKLIFLPRLGHRGWIPIAKLEVMDGGAKIVEKIAPEIPKARFRKVNSKILNGEPVRVLILGSSLLQATTFSSLWPNILFGPNPESAYKLPVKILPVFGAVPGSSNVFQLAQLSDAAILGGGGLIAADDRLRHIRDNVDLVIIGTLANSGADWFDASDLLFKRIYDTGVDVLVVTDNINGPNKDGTVKVQDGIYSSGPRLMELAAKYGFDVADTAAYVAKAASVGPELIYRDSIHMSPHRMPALGVATSVIDGQQIWASAVRSVLSEPKRIQEKRPAIADVGRGQRSVANRFLFLPAENMRMKVGEVNSSELRDSPLPVLPSRLYLAGNAKAKLLYASQNAFMSLSVNCLSSIYAITYGDQQSQPAKVEVTGAIDRLTVIKGGLPFANEWITQVYKTASPETGTVKIEFSGGPLAISSLLFGFQDNCN